MQVVVERMVVSHERVLGGRVVVGGLRLGLYDKTMEGGREWGRKGGRESVRDELAPSSSPPLFVSSLLLLERRGN